MFKDMPQTPEQIETRSQFNPKEVGQKVAEFANQPGNKELVRNLFFGLPNLAKATETVQVARNTSNNLGTLRSQIV